MRQLRQKVLNFTRYRPRLVDRLTWLPCWRPSASCRTGPASPHDWLFSQSELLETSTMRGSVHTRGTYAGRQRTVHRIRTYMESPFFYKRSGTFWCKSGISSEKLCETGTYQYSITVYHYRYFIRLKKPSKTKDVNFKKYTGSTLDSIRIRIRETSHNAIMRLWIQICNFKKIYENSKNNNNKI